MYLNILMSVSWYHFTLGWKDLLFIFQGMFVLSKSLVNFEIIPWKRPIFSPSELMIAK